MEDEKKMGDDNATENKVLVSRRTVLLAALGAAGTAAAGVVPGMMGSAMAATEEEFKIGLFIPLSGPAALFGPSQQACAELAAEELNTFGGIMNRKIKLIPVDGGGAPADAAKSAVRLMLEDKVDMFIGSHDSATRQALVATIKGKVPYIYTPIYEGGECSFNTYVIADTPEQQIRPSLGWMAKEKKVKSVYLIGNDYVWPRKSNEQAKKYVAELGGKIVGEEYFPLGAPNKFEEAITRIKAIKPDLVLITLVGGDNVNFNRAFAGFGLDRHIMRLGLLLEENTLMGIGKENSRNLYSCLSYFSSAEVGGNLRFKTAYYKKFGEKAPPLSLLGVDCFAGVRCARALVNAAKGTNPNKLMAAASGLSFEGASGLMKMYGQHVDKDMFLAKCEGTEFKIVKIFSAVKHGEQCKA